MLYEGSDRRSKCDVMNDQQGAGDDSLYGTLDGYGFERVPPPAAAAAGNVHPARDVGRILDACSQNESRQRYAWSRIDLESLANGTQDGRLVKRLCRKGIPPELRKDVWYRVSGAFRTKRYYEQVLGMTYILYIERGKAEPECSKQISLDVPRTFPNNQWIQSTVGQVSLQRVLYAFSGIHRDIGYCQGMNYIAAMLLLVSEYDEEAAFWIMCQLIGHGESEGILYKNVYASTLSGCHVEMRTLESIVAKKLPRLAHHMDLIDCDFSMVSTEWFLCLYATSLPPETVVRIWDVLFYEGPKILYRIALAILKTHEQDFLATENSGELVKALHFVCASEFDRDALLTAAFHDIGQLSMSQIERVRYQKQMQVDKEVALRESKERLRVAVEEHGHVLHGETGEDDLLSSRACDLENQPNHAKSQVFFNTYFKQRIR